MRTGLASWLAGISGTFVVLALVLLDWRLILLALPPVVFLALAAMRPVPVPVLDVVREASRDRVGVGQEVHVTLRVANRGPRLDLLELYDEIPRGIRVLKGRPHIALALESGAEFALTYTLAPKVKGVDVLVPLVARSSGAAGVEYGD